MSTPVDTDQLNGHAPTAPVYVSFGPRDDDEMPLIWAERGLTWLKENRPAVFADMMLAVLNVARSKGRPR